jgi:outer membrane protein, multidrug efflux system
MIGIRTSAAALLLLTVSGCKLGPNYKRPALDVPGQYRGAPNLDQQQLTGPSFAEMKWPSVYQDPVLQGLIKEALTNNYNVRIAAANIEEASANLAITRANQFPTLSGSYSTTNERSGQLLRGEPTVDTLGLSLSYIVDFWGQYRRATEQARANLLGTDYARSVVIITLISNVASDYFLLRELDDELVISQQTVATQKESVRLNTIGFKGGQYAITDVYQAQLLVQQAESSVITTQELMEQTENNLSILLGRNPGPIARGLKLPDQPHLPEAPPGLPSSLLERRPDVKQAEEALVAANANVGVAKAAFFPQISLTGTFGASSTALTSFLQGPATFWTAGGSVVQPIFEGGRIRANYRLAWAERNAAELTYKQTVQDAFGDVSNDLVGYRQSRAYRQKIEEQTATYAETSRLAEVQFRGGYVSFLQVLTTQQQYFSSELTLAQAWYGELQSYALLYQALGGGWE